MQKSTSKLLRSPSLAPALALLLLGSAAPRLAAQQSDNFDEDGAIPPSTNAAPGWSLYTMALADQNCFSNYPPAVVSFPANPASADNYAVEMYSPPIIFDTCSQGPPRAAIFRTEQQYGSQGVGRTGGSMWHRT